MVKEEGAPVLWWRKSGVQGLLAMEGERGGGGRATWGGVGERWRKRGDRGWKRRPRGATTWEDESRV